MTCTATLPGTAYACESYSKGPRLCTQNRLLLSMAINVSGGATTAQIYPYNHYTCYLCGSALVFHPEWITNRPWFEHTREELTESGRHHCPYVRPEPKYADGTWWYVRHCTFWKGLLLRTLPAWILWSPVLPRVQATYLQHRNERQGSADNTREVCKMSWLFSQLAIQRENLTYRHSLNRATLVVYKPMARLVLRVMSAGLLQP